MEERKHTVMVLVKLMIFFFFFAIITYHQDGPQVNYLKTSIQNFLSEFE